MANSNTQAASSVLASYSMEHMVVNPSFMSKVRMLADRMFAAKGSSVVPYPDGSFHFIIPMDNGEFFEISVEPKTERSYDVVVSHDADLAKYDDAGNKIKWVDRDSEAARKMSDVSFVFISDPLQNDIRCFYELFQQVENHAPYTKQSDTLIKRTLRGADKVGQIINDL